MEGQVLGDHYELTARIGAGGMAEVYAAVDRRLGRTVAVKVLNRSHAGDPSFVERFRREAQLASALSHPNVVTVYDWGESDGAYYLVMEHVAGPSLKDEVRRRGPLPEDEALAVAAQVAAALEAAHRQGVVHRDVKPHNVLLDQHGRARVVDFGIARAAGFGDLTGSAIVLGSAPYLSPEQAQGQPVDARSDLYSLGVVLYELLTGRTPFAGDSPLAVAWQHVHSAPPSPRRLRPNLSEITEAVVLRALAKEPAERFQSAADFQAALERARSLLVTTALEPVAQPAQAGRARALVAALVGLAARARSLAGGRLDRSVLRAQVARLADVARTELAALRARARRLADAGWLEPAAPGVLARRLIAFGRSVDRASLRLWVDRLIAAGRRLDPVAVRSRVRRWASSRPALAALGLRAGQALARGPALPAALAALALLVGAWQLAQPSSSTSASVPPAGGSVATERTATPVRAPQPVATPVPTPTARPAIKATATPERREDEKRDKEKKRGRGRDD